jgi:N,N'-diacetylchitobiose phosphorylase
MDSVYNFLYSEYGIHLNAPSYKKPNDDIGFITRVYGGVKENGAIFSHPNPWAWIAECMQGRGDMAMKYYDALLPYNQNDKIEIREAEPYSYCQFIMGRDHTAHGRARHPWLTGSAGWAYYAATHYILGIRATLEGLIIDPCIPKEWSGFKVDRIWRNAQFMITVQNPSKVSKGVKAVFLNGVLMKGPIPPQKESSLNEVKVIMG